MLTRDPFSPRKPRSVSQLKQFERCAFAYFLARIAEPRAWQRPAAWLPQGSAVHAAIEWWERTGRKGSLEDAQDVFRAEYQKEIASYCRITPNFLWWSKSGPYNALRDIPRRFEIGLEQVAKYIAYANRAEHEVVWIAPDGTPGVELSFDIDLDGVQVRGFIDLVVADADDPEEPKLVRDHKTGNQPGDDFQLGVYSVAIAETYGVPAPVVGDYWMGRAGKPTYPYDLSDWTTNEVTAKFHELEDKIQAGEFMPNPSVDNCKFCDVSDACEYRMA